MKLINSIIEKFYPSPCNACKVKELQQSIIDLLPNYYIFWKDKNSIFLGCNKAFANLLGFSNPKDVIGKTYQDFSWIQEKSQVYLADDQQILESRQAKLNIVETLTSPQNENLIFLTTKVPLYDNQNNIYGILAISYNFTAQKQVEDDLRQTNFKLEHAYQEARHFQDSLIDYIPNYFIFWKDRNSVYLGCNAAYAATAKVKSPADIIGKTDYDLPWSKEETEAYRADDKLVMQTRKPKLNIVEPQTLSDGSKIVLLTSKIPLINEKNEVYGILGIYSDITEQKLNEQKLIDANQQLERAHQVKSEFIRNISHDIRTPLSGIQQVTRLISEGKITEEEIAEYAYSAWEASGKLMDLFNQIISVSRKQEFDFEDKIVKFDLYKLLQDLDKTYDIVAKHKGVALEIEYSDKVPQYLLGKDKRVHRVLLNLLGNALKFTEKGNVKLVVENSQQKDGKVILRFSVVDTGIGIPKEKLDAIFEPFSRIHPSYQGHYPGSGLGLHVVKEYIEKMQGEIYVNSEEGYGSIFTCILPFKIPILNNDNDAEETNYIEEIIIQDKKTPLEVSATSESRIETAGKKYQVLLVEDDALMQKIGVMLLKDHPNYQVNLAKSGEEALKLTEKNLFDIIYMDIGLPGIDGIETVRQIRANPQNLSRDSFITALTAHADEVVAKKCLDVGMQQVLVKPLSSEKINQIHEQIKHSNLSDDEENKKVFDWDLWLTRLEQNEKFAEKTFHLLAQDLISNKNLIIKAYESGDMFQLKAITHKLKGALGYCGLPRLETAMRAIEEGAKQNNIEEVNKWYQETLAALDESNKIYQTWSKKHPKQSD